jgi:hypothetical protein
LRISWVVAQLSASQEGLSFMKLDNIYRIHANEYIVLPHLKIIARFWYSYYYHHNRYYCFDFVFITVIIIIIRMLYLPCFLFCMCSFISFTCANLVIGPWAVKLARR